MCIWLPFSIGIAFKKILQDIHQFSIIIVGNVRSNTFLC